MDLERKQLLEVKVITNNSHTLVNLADDLNINTDDINTAYIEQPGKFAYWATVALQAKFACERKKQEVNRQEEFLRKTLYGKLDSMIRIQLETDGERITEAKVINAINTHKDYLIEQEHLSKSGVKPPALAMGI